MSFKIGIVGLPNVGKSTLFRAITKKQVDVENYPFCTIDPNVGTVQVPDERLEKLSRTSNSEKTIHTTIEFVDIAGLVKGAHQGKGLGNKFLSNIREVDAILEVLRDFENKDITHVEGSVNLERDRDIINIELIMADLQLIEKVFTKIERDAKSGDKESVKKFELLKKIKSFLEEEKMIKDLNLKEEEINLIKEFNLLTLKPIIYLVNVDDKVSGDKDDYIEINAKIEDEVAGFSADEAKEYLEFFNIKESGLTKLIKKSYQSLDLISFFTSGEKESRAWTVKKESTAPIAAGRIHTDFEKSFIRAEVISWEDFVSCGGWTYAKEKGLVKDKGKDYLVNDGDVIFFKVGR